MTPRPGREPSISPTEWGVGGSGVDDPSLKALEVWCRRRNGCAVLPSHVQTDTYRDSGGEDVRWTCLTCGAVAHTSTRAAILPKSHQCGRE